ncbi:response regulator transcription factor [Streptomyces sp. NPDC008001]|uniref:response regulator transcription factor n=1 Tax=Streptomyces sp. NPDC008001 TaxID=3364804 RepID=UPI0036E00947
MDKIATEAAISPLGDLHVLLYRMALEQGRLRPSAAAIRLDVPQSEVRAAVEDLSRLHLLHPAEEGHGTAPPPGEPSAGSPLDTEYAPRSPDVAVTHVTGPIEAKIQQLHRESERMSCHVMAMKPVFEESWHGHFTRTPIEYLTLLDAVRSALERLSASARVEVAAAHPDLPAPATLEEGLQRTTEVIGRGVLMRTIYPHSVLTHAYMQQHLSRMVALGAQIRTTAHVPDRILFFDATTAVLADHGSSPGEGKGALAVRDPSLVRFLYRSWESVWESARPFTGATDDGSAKDELRRSILELLESGMKDGMAARRLAMSVTTYRRHVTELLAELGAQSRFQAGSYARRAGLLDG